MLTRILTTEVDAKKATKGLYHLMENRYLRCASGTTTKQREGTGTMPECFCKSDAIDTTLVQFDPKESVSVKKWKGIPANLAKPPKYWSCKYLEFVKENLVEVVYNLMTEDQRKKFHLRSAKYLDTSSFRCENCGGGNTSYNFGVVLKSGDLGMIDSEDAMRIATASRRKSGGTSSKLGDGDHENIAQKKDTRKTSTQTKVEGIKRVLQNNGTKIGQIEVDILKTLRHIEGTDKSKCKCCKGNNTDEEEAALIEAELHALRDPVEGNLVNLKTPDSKTVQTTQNVGDSGSGNDLFVDVRPIDLRMCECAALQSKVCIEMVKHYREAQKYGKCLVNLLEAAESVITIGNGTQALVHLEDTVGLMKAIQKGIFPAPSPDDQDDATIDYAEADGQVEYLSGLAYFEIGVHTKARDFFIKALARVGLIISSDEHRLNKEASIMKAKSKLWRSHKFGCCRCARKQSDDNTDESWSKKIRILSYLHVLFKQDKQMELALLVTLWEVITAEEYGDEMQDVIPAYCNMMEMYEALSQHKEAERYIKLALNVIRSSFGTNEQIDPVGLMTTATLFFTISNVRLSWGSLDTAAEAGYLSLRIASFLHDNSLIVRLMPTLIQSLILSLRVTEAIEALQKLWYTSEEDDDWCGVAMYYTLCLELLLNTGA
jgi:tetratricopeptide (TPR) repeat protein